MYILRFAKTFPTTYNALIKGDKKLEKRTEKAFKLLRIDPQYPSLKSHKANTRHYGVTWSSWITGDLRIIWNFDAEKKLVILLLAITTHAGTHREYK